MNNICIFTNTLLSGGSEKQAVLLAKALNSKYNVWLVVYYGENVDQKLLDLVKENEIKIIFLFGLHPRRIYILHKFLKKYKISVIFSYLLTTNLIAAFVGKLAGIKYTIGGIRSSLLAPKKLPIQRFIHNYLNYKTIFNNYSGFKSLTTEGFKEKKSIVIPNCIEMINQPINRNNKNTINILSVGRFHKSKDYYTALKTIQYLKNKDFEIEYTIVGWGELENNIRKWIIELQLEKYVKIIINPSKLENYYIQADIFLQTSIFEGTSNTIMEAMNYSLPIVTTGVGDNDILVIHGKNGYLVNVKDISELSNNIQKLIQSYSLRTKFGEYSHYQLKMNYSNNIFRRKYIDLINSLN